MSHLLFLFTLSKWAAAVSKIVGKLFSFDVGLQLKFEKFLGLIFYASKCLEGEIKKSEREGERERERVVCIYSTILGCAQNLNLPRAFGRFDLAYYIHISGTHTEAY